MRTSSRVCRWAPTITWPSRSRLRNWCCACRPCCAASRIGAELDTRLRLGEDVEVDCRNLQGRRGDEALAFTRREVEMLQYLRLNPDRPVSRDELLAKVWGYARNSLSRPGPSISISRSCGARSKRTRLQPRYLVTVRGAGYRLLAD